MLVGVFGSRPPKEGGCMKISRGDLSLLMFVFFTAGATTVAVGDILLGGAEIYPKLIVMICAPTAIVGGLYLIKKFW